MIACGKTRNVVTEEGLRYLIAVIASVTIAGCANPPAAPAPADSKPPGAAVSKPPNVVPPPAAPAPPAEAATKTAKKAAPSASAMSAKDAKAITAYHNKVRAALGVGPLNWSRGLATLAQNWANHLAATSCKMQHRSDNDYGENLFQGTAGHYTAVDAAKAWETEKKDYRGGVLTQSNWMPAGHYTQMIWRDTKRLGCGEAVCNKTLIVACNYDPPGNVIGRKPY